MAALHKQYIRQRAADKEDPEDEFYTKNCFVCGEVAKPDQVIFFLRAYSDPGNAMDSSKNSM
jgi:hypothetical protein